MTPYLWVTLLDVVKEHGVFIFKDLEAWDALVDLWAAEDEGILFRSKFWEPIIQWHSIIFENIGVLNHTAVIT
jgi:hypothetical protein